MITCLSSESIYFKLFLAGLLTFADFAPSHPPWADNGIVAKYFCCDLQLRGQLKIYASFPFNPETFGNQNLGKYTEVQLIF